MGGRGCFIGANFKVIVFIQLQVLFSFNCSNIYVEIFFFAWFGLSKFDSSLSVNLSVGLDIHVKLLGRWIR